MVVHIPASIFHLLILLYMILFLERISHSFLPFIAYLSFSTVSVNLNHNLKNNLKILFKILLLSIMVPCPRL